MSLHPTAIIHPSAKLGPDVEIGPYVVIGPGVTLGARSRILSHAVIEYTTMGEECVVYPQVTIGLAPQHMGYKNEPTSVVVGNRCTFREGVTVHRGTPLDRGVTILGDSCYLMAYSHVAHDCVLGNSVIMANESLLAGHVKVGDRSFISALTGIHQFGRIGNIAMISGGAMVSSDVIPFAIAQGDRAKIVGINVVGLRRAGVPRESVKLIKEAYRTLFFSKLTIAEALKTPALTIEDPNIKMIREFISESKLGFARPATRSFDKFREDPS